MFLRSPFEASIIIEDDVEIVSDLLERASQILVAVPTVDIVKLFNHRIRGFRRITTTISGDEIGRCLHGPQGSAACYIVTRNGARKITTAMQIMAFPFDVALERGWDHGANIVTVRENIIELSRHSQNTQIGTRADYRATKFSGARRLPTHVLRVIDICARHLTNSLWTALRAEDAIHPLLFRVGTSLGRFALRRINVCSMETVLIR